MDMKIENIEYEIEALARKMEAHPEKLLQEIIEFSRTSRYSMEEICLIIRKHYKGEKNWMRQFSR